MALAASSFNDKAVANGANAIEIALDLEKNGSFNVFCVESGSMTVADKLIEYTDLCGGGLSNKIPVGVSLSIPFSAIIRKGDIADELYNNITDINARQGIPVRYDNTLVDSRISFVGTVSISGVTGDAADLIKLTGTIEIGDASTLKQESPIPANTSSAPQKAPVVRNKA